MLLQLDTSDERPIYAQIADQLKFAVAGGVLRPGDLVPSVRELSKTLVVNPNTVARAYRGSFRGSSFWRLPFGGRASR